MGTFYNTIFGKSPASGLLLAVLGLREEDFYRFRDCYLDETGRIAVYTRGGASNRECWCDEYANERDRTVLFNEELHEPSCAVVLQGNIRAHSHYLSDEDDGFDTTYATFYFSVPAAVDRSALEQVQPELKRDDLWRLFLKGLQKP